MARLILLPSIAVSAAIAAARLSTKAPAEFDGAGGFVAALLAIVAAVALVKVTPEERRRTSRAEAALVGFLFFCGSGIVYPVMQGARAAGSKGTCLSNVKQLAVGAMMYLADNDDRLPLSASWRHTLQPYVRAELRCPKSPTPWSYAINRPLSGLDVTKLRDPRDTVLFFEADGPYANISGGREMFVPRHDETGNFAFSDGGAKRVGRQEAAALTWNP